MPLELPRPVGLDDLLERLRAAGGRPYLVGGVVRDALLGLPAKDFDVEVYGLPEERLRAALASVGQVDAVGAAFTVYKVSGLEGLDEAVDVSLPRRDSKVGPGHRGIAAASDPDLEVREAARRRDFTMNALLLDPATGDVLDPFGGRADLEAKVLRAVDPETFGEDPLRPLRAVQFAARFGLEVEAGTAKLSASMPLGELPRERVFGEVEKLLLKAKEPSRGFVLLREWGLLPTVAPELVSLAGTPQDPEWHPEGDVWVHTLQVIDEAAGLIDELREHDRPRALTVMLAALCHDLGKPTTTAFEEGHVRSRGHEEAGVAPTESLLDRWNVFTRDGYDVRGQVVALVKDHLKPGELYKDRARLTDGAIRRLARKCEPSLLYRVARADCLGRRPGRFEPVAMEWFLERARALDVAVDPPAPLLKGRDVVALGVPPGPEVGKILKAVYELQLDGSVRNAADAIEAARHILADKLNGGDASKRAASSKGSTPPTRSPEPPK